MAWITATEVRERMPQVSTTVYSDANIDKVIARAEAEIKASGGRYRDMLQGHVFGEVVNLSPTSTIGNKRIKAKGAETAATLGIAPIVSGSFFLFKNASQLQNYRHIVGDEAALLTLTTDYSLTTSTGVVSFVSALLSGDMITATYDFTMDTTSRAPRILLELAKSLAAYYVLEILYGKDNMSDASEVVQSYKVATDILKLMNKDQYSIPEFDAISLVSLEEWGEGDIKSGKIIRC